MGCCGGSGCDQAWAILRERRSRAPPAGAAADSGAVADCGAIRSCSCAIQVRVPKMAATSAGTYRSTSRAAQRRLKPTPSTLTRARLSGLAPCRSCRSDDQEKTPMTVPARIGGEAEWGGLRSGLTLWPRWLRICLRGRFSAFCRPRCFTHDGSSPRSVVNLQ